MRLFLLFTIFILLTITIHSQIIRIPTDQPTIQAGIDAASDGDTVLVAEGRYFENINFNGKAILLASHFIIDKDKAHIDNTIIDGSQPQMSNRGSVILFESGEDTSSVVCGFTLTRGSGGIGGDHRSGGGISVISSGCKIIYNKIVENYVTYSASVGGGIIVYNPIKKCIIANNLIAFNEERSTSLTGGGGGIHIGEDRNGRVLIENNYIAHNKSSSASSLGRGAGGGIDLNQSCSIVRNNIIVFNQSYQGGGIDVFDGNHMDGAIIENNTIAYNHATSSFGGGILDGAEEGEIPIRNCILWGNSAGDSLNQISKNSQINNVDMEYSLVQGGYEGEGNIDADPLFVDTLNFYLSALSPCIDAGNPDILFNDVEDENNISFALFPAEGNLRNDIGAFGGSNSVWKLMDFISEVKIEELIIPKSFRLSQNYPNPFNPSTTIKYSIPADMRFEYQDVRLVVYDVLGSEVATLVNEKQTPGNYEVDFDGSSLSSGIYFYRIQAGDPETSSGQVFVETKKMILLK